MKDFDSLILNLTIRVYHQTDFSFATHKGELANKLQSIFSTSQELRDISIDDDGDISMRIQKGTLYITENSTLLVGWLTTPGEIANGEFISPVSHLLNRITELRAQSSARRYDARIFFNFTPRPLVRGNFQSLQARCHGPSLSSILGSNAPAKTNTYSLSANFQRADFSDSLEVESSFRNIQLRYGREGAAENFPSLASFLGSANLSEIIENLRPFISEIIADPQMLGGRVFKDSNE